MSLSLDLSRQARSSRDSVLSGVQANLCGPYREDDWDHWAEITRSGSLVQKLTEYMLCQYKLDPSQR